MVKMRQRIQFLARCVNDDNKRNVMIHTFQTVLTLPRWHSCNSWTFARLENIKNCNCVLVSSIYPAKSNGSVWLQVIFTYLSALRLNVIQCGATNRSRWSTILYDAFVSTELISIISLQRNKTHTLLSEASIISWDFLALMQKSKTTRGYWVSQVNYNKG